MGKESILLYSSQQQRPFAYFDNLQLDSLTCMSWTPDGRVLVISSQEGYNTLVLGLTLFLFILEILGL